jgi:hypothetical protein
VASAPWSTSEPKITSSQAVAAGQLLAQQDRERVGLLARGAPGHPDAERLAGVGALDERHDHVPAQRLPGVPVAEERRDRDQEVVEERVDLLGIVAQIAQVRVEAPRRG